MAARSYVRRYERDPLTLPAAPLDRQYVCWICGDFVQLIVRSQQTYWCPTCRELAIPDRDSARAERKRAQLEREAR